VKLLLSALCCVEGKTMSLRRRGTLWIISKEQSRRILLILFEHEIVGLIFN